MKRKRGESGALIYLPYGKEENGGSAGISFPLPKGKFASVLAGYWKKRGRFKGGEGFIRCAVALLCFRGFPTGGEIFGSASFSPIPARKNRLPFVFTQRGYSRRCWEICMKLVGFDV